MRTRRTGTSGALLLILVVSGCTGGGDGEADPGPSGGGTRSTPAPTRDPAAVVDAARAAMTEAGSAVVTRVTQRKARGGDVAASTSAFTHEEIEVAFASPGSARVLHVGEEIWTLNVVDGVGYLKDQSERKSVNRWQRLDEADTAAHLADVMPQGLLEVFDAATSVAAPRAETVREVPATCHQFTLDPARADTLSEPKEGASPTRSPSASTPTPAPEGTASARLCLDGNQRPVESVVRVGDAVTTSVFGQWGFAVEAMPPPPNLVDGAGEQADD